MDIVDVILSVTTAFFIIILFSTITYEQGLTTAKIDEYANKMEAADRAFESLLSPGLPEYWYVSPSDATYFGILKENYGYELDSVKFLNLSSICSSNESLLKEKLFIPSDYNVYIEAYKILSAENYSACSPPQPANNTFIRETFVEYDGDIAHLKMVMWK